MFWRSILPSSSGMQWGCYEVDGLHRVWRRTRRGELTIRTKGWGKDMEMIQANRKSPIEGTREEDWVRRKEEKIFYCKNQYVMKCCYVEFQNWGFSWNNLSNTSMTPGTSESQESLYDRFTEIAKHKLDLVGTQEVRWEKGGTDPGDWN
jgi:hypothetical protein